MQRDIAPRRARRQLLQGHLRASLAKAQTNYLAMGSLAFVFFLAIALLILFALPAARGNDNAASPEAAAANGAAFDAYLQAGEFPRALQMADAAGRGEARDLMLEQIAAAQTRIGAREASFATALEIDSDRIRAQAAATMGEQTVQPWFHRGGAAEADFDALIELITTTIAPDSWDDLGGPGSIAEFAGGVYVDAQGTLRRLREEGNFRPARGSRLLDARAQAAMQPRGEFAPGDVRRPATLRKVSLTRLERMAQLMHAQGRAPDDAMRHLAGLTEIKYIFIYPETGDIVLAGPAGDWIAGADGRQVNAATGKPVLHLDDLVVALRNAWSDDPRFGCSIVPRQENLAATKQFLQASAEKPLPAGDRARNEWLDGLRTALGKQDIEVYGVDPRTRLARVLVEADYHMKLVGMGLEEGTHEVPSYLSRITFARNEAPPAMEVFRWWFTLNYQGVTTSAGRRVFELRGPGVKVLSENEFITERGERVATGKADEWNREFAHDFTRNYSALADKYPVYAELRNVFDMALVAALLRSENAPTQVSWHMTHFGPQGAYQVALDRAPSEVETIMNHRLMHGKHIIAGVSGGVQVDCRELVKGDAIEQAEYGSIDSEHASGTPSTELSRDRWWWD